MSSASITVAVIKGDGIGPDVTDAATAAIDAAVAALGLGAVTYQEIKAGAGVFKETGRDIEPGGDERAGQADAILLGAIGLPSVRQKDGTEITPHLRLREIYQLYAGVRPVRAYPNGPQRLADPRARDIDLIILRESTEGLFYSAAVHGRAEVIGDTEVRETLRITRATTEKLHTFAFNLARKRKARRGKALVTCVDKANVFESMAFFRRIFDEVAEGFPDIETGRNYVDAQALDLIRQPWAFDILVMENMFGDIISDLGGGLVGGMGMASCAEIGDDAGLFQPAHGSAPDIAGQDKANPLAAILSGGLLLDYLAEKLDRPELADAGLLIDDAVYRGFYERLIDPMEFGGTMGTRDVAATVCRLIGEPQTRDFQRNH
ncbi:isocitrate/isopropylmalate family dehydrogenase [Bauldia litoralis]|uniref:isocitrate/isopropylmalate family dehydrogenase n=1 Tax=Bauldia litoralis TaxID=665467 RepID=UPI0032668B3D